MDEDLLTRCLSLQRVIFTHDIRFRVLAEAWQAQGRPFAGLIFGHQLAATLGRYVIDLEFVCKNSEQEEWSNQILLLPL